MCTLYAFMVVMVMCAWIWLVYWHFAEILVSLRDNKVESESELFIFILKAEKNIGYYYYYYSYCI